MKALEILNKLKNNGNSLSYHKGTDSYCSEFEAKE